MSSYDAVVIGSGPNGLAAAITLAERGLSVLVREAQPAIGGGARSAALTLPGFVHDVCSGIHPLAAASPFFRTRALERFGLEWIHPAAPLAHPFDDGSAAILERSVDETAAGLGPDARSYRRLFGPLLRAWDQIVEGGLAPVLRVPRHPIALARFGWQALKPTRRLVRSAFRTERAQALFAGSAAHAMVPLERRPSAAFGLVLGLAGHAVGWPFPRGGSQTISDALATHLRSLGGEIVTGSPVETIDECPARLIMADVTPRQLLRIAGHRLSRGDRRRLARFRYGPAAFKMDWALREPIPWRAGECRRAGTVHLGGTLAEISASLRAAWTGRPTDRPFVLVGQQSLFDRTRAPQGRHTGWAYCHVPHGSTRDMSAAIEQQIERFAPGFRDCILATSSAGPAHLEQQNANLVGGDIGGGAYTLLQTLLRPSWRLYRTSLDHLYLCSSSTPPGSGVHGLCGYFAALAALRRLR